MVVLKLTDNLNFFIIANRHFQNEILLLVATYRKQTIKFIL